MYPIRLHAALNARPIYPRDVIYQFSSDRSCIENPCIIQSYKSDNFQGCMNVKKSGGILNLKGVLCRNRCIFGGWESCIVLVVPSIWLRLFFAT